jgi:uncharacterized protein (UPF0261 family)
MICVVHQLPSAYCYPGLRPLRQLRAQLSVFAAAIKKALPQGVPVVEFDYHINDAEFADAIVAQVMAFTSKRQTA